MMDMLPFPRNIDGTPEERISELHNYLIQFKETLEFILMNISTENLSPELIDKLNQLGANIEESKVSREDELTQITHNALTISDVCNSELFKSAVKSEIILGINLNVNTETGHLEYSNFVKEV